MEVKAIKIGDSVGIIFPKEANVHEGDIFSLRIIDGTYILTPKIKDIYYTDEFWGDFRNEMTEEDKEWDAFT